MKYIAYKEKECPQCKGEPPSVPDSPYDIFGCSKCLDKGTVLEQVPFDEAADEWFRKQRPKQEDL